MRIGLIIYGSLDTLSGGYLYDRQLVNFLRGTGCHVDLISLPWRDYATHLRDNFRLDWARQVAGARYDILLQDELNHPSLFLLNAYLRRISPTPIVSIVHHLRSNEKHPAHFMPIYRAVERHYLCTVDGFICNSRTTLRNVRQMVKRAAPHVVAFPAADHLSPPTHDEVTRAIATRRQQQGPLQLLFIGNLMARKGLHTVLNALACLDSTDWHLHVVGSETVDPLYSAAMRQRANTLALTPRITWHGQLPDHALSALLANSDLLTMPSFEGFGIVYLEAMAYGLPVLAAQTGAAPEVVHSGINGYLTAPDDDEAFSACLRLLANNRSQLATLAYHARLHYEAHPTWSMSMGRAYQWLCESNFRERPRTE